MPPKEASARIKINKLLEAAGWRFFADGAVPANIRLEPTATIKTQDINDLSAKRGLIDSFYRCVHIHYDGAK
jgi:type I restriction enzyme, R subunit